MQKNALVMLRDVANIVLQVANRPRPQPRGDCVLEKAVCAEPHESLAHLRRCNARPSLIM